MRQQMFLSDDDHLCVLCGNVSDKGIVGQVEDNRFFNCAMCLEGEIPLLLGKFNFEAMLTGEQHFCVYCGKISSLGHSVNIRNNWTFICESCINGNLFYVILTNWWGLKRILKSQLAPTPLEQRLSKYEKLAENLRKMAKNAIKSGVKKLARIILKKWELYKNKYYHDQRLAGRIKEPLKFLESAIKFEIFGKNQGKFTEIFRESSKTIPTKKILEFFKNFKESATEKLENENKPENKISNAFPFNLEEEMSRIEQELLNDKKDDN